MDTGSTDSFIHPNIVSQLEISVCKKDGKVSMASTELTGNISGQCFVDLTVNARKCHNQKLDIWSDLVYDIILGTDFQQQHYSNP